MTCHHQSYQEILLSFLCPLAMHRSHQGQVRPTPEEIQRLMDLPATSDLGDFAAFSGGPPPGSGGNMGSVPSRLLMQQLYDAGVGRS